MLYKQSKILIERAEDVKPIINKLSDANFFKKWKKEHTCRC